MKKDHLAEKEYRYGCSIDCGGTPLRVYARDLRRILLYQRLYLTAHPTTYPARNLPLPRLSCWEHLLFKPYTHLSHPPDKRTPAKLKPKKQMLPA